MSCSTWSWCKSFKAGAQAWKSVWAETLAGSWCSVRQVLLLGLIAVAADLFFQSMFPLYPILRSLLWLVYTNIAIIWYQSRVLRTMCNNQYPWYFYLTRSVLVSRVLFSVWFIVATQIALFAQVLFGVSVYQTIVLALLGILVGSLLGFIAAHRAYTSDGIGESLALSARMAWGEWPALLAAGWPIMWLVGCMTSLHLAVAIGWVPVHIMAMPAMAYVVRYAIPVFNVTWMVLSTGFFVAVYRLRKNKYLCTDMPSDNLSGRCC